jgi:hypothetical protein
VSLGINGVGIGIGIAGDLAGDPIAATCLREEQGWPQLILGQVREWEWQQNYLPGCK